MSVFPFFAPQVPEVSPQTVHERRAAGETLLLLDVRQPDEYEEARVAGSTLIPLGELPQRVAELPSEQPIVVMCRSGQRSATAVRFLQQAGFEQVENLAGGILAWAQRGLPVEQE